LAVRPADVDLHKRPGQPFQFPWRGCVAGLEPHRYILDPHRLARLQRQVANDAVALVEQPQHGHPLGHRRDPRLVGGRAWDFHGQRLVIRFVAPVASGKQRQCGKEDEGARKRHSYSGFHAS
jgi:hypothetical protein